MQVLLKWLCRGLGAAIVALCSIPAHAQTVPPLPSNKLITAPLVTPSAAWTYYGSATTHTTGVAAFTSTPPEIVALARSLGADRIGTSPSQVTSAAFAQNVYAYLHSGIETEFRFGLAKGGRGALIDHSARHSTSRS